MDEAAMVNLAKLLGCITDENELKAASAVAAASPEPHEAAESESAMSADGDTTPTSGLQVAEAGSTEEAAESSVLNAPATSPRADLVQDGFDHDSPSGESSQHLQRQRMVEFKSSALAEKDPKSAMFNAAAADALQLHACIRDRLRDALDNGDLSEVAAWSQMYDKTGKQSQSFAALARKLEQDQHAKQQAEHLLAGKS